MKETAAHRVRKASEAATDDQDQNDNAHPEKPYRRRAIAPEWDESQDRQRLRWTRRPRWAGDRWMAVWSLYNFMPGRLILYVMIVQSMLFVCLLMLDGECNQANGRTSPDAGLAIVGGTLFLYRKVEGEDTSESGEPGRQKARPGEGWRNKLCDRNASVAYTHTYRSMFR